MLALNYVAGGRYDPRRFPMSNAQDRRSSRTDTSRLRYFIFAAGRIDLAGEISTG